jgi:uncharacterized RmlC-like cupin family protein
MAEKKYEKYFLKEPFGKVMRGGPGIKVPPGTPIDKPYWIGIGQEEPEAWGFPLSMVLRPIWQQPPGYEDGGGTHSHHEGEVLYFIGGDPMNFKEFGAEVEFHIDGEQYFITSTTFVYIPPDVPHCPLFFRKVDKPIMFGHIMFTPMYESTQQKP